MYRSHPALFPFASLPITEAAICWSISPRALYHPDSISLAPDALASRRGDRKPFTPDGLLALDGVRLRARGPAARPACYEEKRSRAASSVREDSMYAAIRQAKAKTGTAEELARRIKEGAIPIISDVEGFMAYYVVYAPDDTVTAISLFNNFASAEEANRRALAWIEQNLGPLLVGPASAVAGPVIVHTLA
jgi:hypothetical protein